MPKIIPKIKKPVTIKVDVSGINASLDAIEQRIDTLQNKADVLKATLNECGVSADKRIEELEHSDKKHVEMHKETIREIGSLKLRIKALESELAAERSTANADHESTE